MNDSRLSNRISSAAQAYLRGIPRLYLAPLAMPFPGHRSAQPLLANSTLPGGFLLSKHLPTSFHTYKGGWHPLSAASLRCYEENSTGQNFQLHQSAYGRYDETVPAPYPSALRRCFYSCMYNRAFRPQAFDQQAASRFPGEGALFALRMSEVVGCGGHTTDAGRTLVMLRLSRPPAWKAQQYHFLCISAGFNLHLAYFRTRQTEKILFSATCIFFNFLTKISRNL